MKLSNAFGSTNSNTNQALHEEKKKYYLNNEETVFLTLSEDTVIVEGNGKIDEELWRNLIVELNLRNSNIEIKRNVQLPDRCAKMFFKFEKEINIHPGIDTSNIINMADMFYEATSANPDTSNWDTSNVISMSCMFFKATSANPDTSNWDVSNVTRMVSMFSGAISANPNTSNWNTSNVTNMDYMFYEATLANPDTSHWDVSNVTDMAHMFEGSAYTGNPL